MMGSSFQTGAYFAAGVSVLLAVNYVLRLVTPGKPMAGGDENQKFIDVNGELLPSPTGNAVGGWPKEFAAFALAGCLFGSISFIQASAIDAPLDMPSIGLPTFELPSVELPSLPDMPSIPDAPSVPDAAPLAPSEWSE